MFHYNAFIVLRAYPMLARNQVTLQNAIANSVAKVTISTVDGRLVKKVVAPFGSAVQTDVDLTALDAGMYNKFDDGKEQMQSLKLLKQ